jgi:AmmeMemoRadiSam system protein B/AmmeMemoRadiSam system protein A
MEVSMNRKILSLVLALGLLLPACRHKETAIAKIRPAARAGQFYPLSRHELLGTVRSLLDQSSETGVKGEVLGLWVPHAGYEYSGRIAANAFRLVEGAHYDAVLLIGPSHYADFQGAAVADWDSVATPLGNIPVDRNLVRSLVSATNAVRVMPDVDREEHSLEVELPFIQTVLPGVPVALVLVRDMPHEECSSLADAIAASVRGKRVLLVASSDMSHFPGYKDACETDHRTLAAVGAYDTRKILKLERELPAGGIPQIPGLACVLCGSGALVTVMLAAKALGADAAQLLPYANSGDAGGTKDRVVGYGAAAFVKTRSAVNSKGGNFVKTEDIQFNPDEKKKLFRVARESILAALSGERPHEFEIPEPNLQLKRGVFVTLTHGDRLRGCIGHFEPDMPLYEIVSQMAVAAATQDYRFFNNPVTGPEMKNIHIKISILSPLRKIQSIDEIEIGKHGIWVRMGGKSGTYLPEVATDMGWDRIQFLESCCEEKAGLPADAWKNGADIYIYSSQVLEEK